jgi:phosphoribosylanthranilate isomerase
MITPIEIKICGITNLEDARTSAQLGANMLGFNFYPGSPRYIEPKSARRIIEAIAPGVCPVGVFVDASAEAIREVADTAGLRCVQLHGHASPDICRGLGHEFRVIRAFSMDFQFRPEEVSLFGDCDVLVDAHHPKLRGGTGLTCDWQAARKARSFTRFLILSGGLTERNVGHAITTVVPHAVDVCSGVESAPGAKNHTALKDFIAGVRVAECSLHAASTHDPTRSVIPSPSTSLRTGSAKNL